MLQVRFAEVNRSALKELGAVLFGESERLGGACDDGTVFCARVSTTTPRHFADLLNLFFFSKSEGIGVVMRALQQKGLFQSLAEPNLIAYNGQEASFLAGGEFPVPFVAGTTGQVTVQFKEFGIRLNFSRPSPAT